jgi:hypothetical protein
MKQCIECDLEYPDTENFCEMDSAYLLTTDELDELPPGVCPVHRSFAGDQYRR